MYEDNNNLQTIQSVNLYFGKKDADLCRWVHSVPRGLFSYLVREAIKSHLNGDSNYRLPTFDIKNCKNTAITKPLSISCDTPEDKQVYNFVTSFDDNMRSYEIKQILRKYLASSTDGSVDKSINIAPSKAFNPEPTSIVENSTKKPVVEKKDDRITKFIESTRNRSRAK
jgi:hypothetical protein